MDLLLLIWHVLRINMLFCDVALEAKLTKDFLEREDCSKVLNTPGVLCHCIQTLAKKSCTESWVFCHQVGLLQIGVVHCAIPWTRPYSLHRVSTSKSTCRTKLDMLVNVFWEKKWFIKRLARLFIWTELARCDLTPSRNKTVPKRVFCLNFVCQL